MLTPTATYTFLTKNALVMTVSTHSIQLAGGGAHKVINMRTHKQSQTLEIQNQLWYKIPIS